MNTNVVTFQNLYVAIHSPDKCEKYIVFVHGGPGSHSAYFEQALAHFSSYRQGSQFGWICYDQRGCGRSVPAPSKPTHQQNIVDLEALLEYLQRSQKLLIAAVMGHSYGARLSFDLFEKRPDLIQKLVLLGLGAGAKAPRNRSLLMDLIAMKISQPNDYESFSVTLRDHTGPMFTLASVLREKMKDTDLRKFFYWGNLNAMQWYFSMRKDLSLSENDDVYRSVRETMYQGESPLNLPDVNQLKEKQVLWILGFHDFLMGGESLEDDSRPILQFQGSGHYPHFEEPEKLIFELNKFLGVKTTS